MKATVSIQKLLRRLCTALCSFALLFALLPTTSARAASSAESAAAIMKITNGTEEVYYPAVVLNIGGVATCFSPYPEELQDTSKVEVGSFIGENYHTVTEQGYLEKSGLILWEIDDAFENESFSLAEGYASTEGQNCTLLFIDSDTSELNIEQDVILGEVYNQNSGQNSGIVYISGVSSNSVYYPAALVDGGGNIVGVALSKSSAYVFKYTETSSSGNSGGSSSSSSSNQPRPRTNTDSKTSEGLLFVVVGIAVVAVIAVLFLKKKKVAPAPAPAPKGTNDVNINRNVVPNNNETVFFPDDNRLDEFEETRRPDMITLPQTLWLAATSGYMMGRVYPMANNEITIGRSPTASVPYEDNSVSKQHCKLYKNASGQWMLMDCNSRNGTYVERIGKLSPMQPVEIYPGDTFYLGSKKHGFTIKNN